MDLFHLDSSLLHYRFLLIPNRVIQMSVDGEMLSVTIAWRKSSRSKNDGACVEVAAAIRTVLVRDSMRPAGRCVRYSARAWQAFIARAKESEVAMQP